MEVDLESGEDEEDEGPIEDEEGIDDNDDDNVIVAESVSDEDDQSCDLQRGVIYVG